MRVSVKLFGPQSQLVGCREVEVEVGDGATAEQLRTELGRVEPRLAPSLDRSRLAINQVFAPDATRIEPGDEVALIGMLGGG